MGNVEPKPLADQKPSPPKSPSVKSSSDKSPSDQKIFPPTRVKTYAMKLENGMWYIDSSETPKKRFLEHAAGKGPEWTRMHAPIAIHKYFDTPDQDSIVKEYMKEYGIDKVRGGSYSGEIIDDPDQESIQREIWITSGACLVCGRASHRSLECHETYDVTGRLIGEKLL